MMKNFAIKTFLRCGMGILLVVGSGFGQVRNCDFWGTANYRGTPVSSGDVIEAYDSGGQLCGTAYYVGGGNYGIHVIGDDPGTPEDEGAPEGGAITFRINGEIADVVSGSSTWTNGGSVECNIYVPDLPPDANPGGPYSGSEGALVAFDGSGSTGAVTYSWSFGDGGTSTEMKPTHTYADNGTYTVSLTVTNNTGQSDTKQTTATISNVAPSANPSSNAPQPEGSPVSFSANASDPGDANDPLTYSWNFGDGGTSTQENPTHTYADNGTYNVQLTVSDGDGGVTTKNISVEVTNVPPTADAGPDKAANEGQSVSFSGSATDPAEAHDPLTYFWNFGDGGTATGQNVSHAYGDNGVYTVTLSVSDGDGGVGTDQLTVTVSNVAPTANAGGSYYGVVNYPVQLQGTAADPGSGDISSNSYTWDLDNDGQYDDATGPNPTYTWTSTGTYPISLKVTDKDGAWDTDNTTVEVGIGVPYTFRTEPTGLSLKIDGVMYTAPQTMYFLCNTTHTVEAPLNQNEEAGQREAFHHWSNGQARSFSFVVGTAPTEWTAVYQREYLLYVETGGKPVTVQGHGYHPQGTQVTISFTPTTVTDSSGTTRYRFDRWQGTGNGSYTGAQLFPTITMNGPITETMLWSGSEYYVRVESQYGTPHGSGWYTIGSQATFWVDTAVVSGPGRRLRFLSWVGQGSGSYTGNLNPVTIQVNGPVTETAQWHVEYLLDIQSEYGNPVGEGWYLEGQTVTIRCDTLVSVQTGKRARFLEWTGTGSGSYTGSVPQATVTMNGPITETVRWKTQYLLVVDSEYGIPSGSGWYDEGALVSFSVDSVVQVDSQTRYRFSGWSGIGQAGYTGSDNPAQLLVTSPITEVAEWRAEYYFSINILPSGAGHVLPFLQGGGWVAQGDTVELRAVGNAEQGYGFSYWSGDITGSLNPYILLIQSPKNITANFVKGNIFISTHPPGLFLYVDGDTLISPVVFNWPIGSQHQIGTLTLQGDLASSRFEFKNWSDDGALNHQVTISSATQNFVATFDEYYYLKVVSEHGNSTGEGWYKKGTWVDVKVDSMEYQGQDTRWVFKGWTGTGPGGVTSTASTVQCQVNGPIIQQADWELQYRVRVTAYPLNMPELRVEILPFQQEWYPAGMEMTLQATSTNPEHGFLSWSGSVTSTTNPLTLVVSKPLQIFARFRFPDDPPEIHSLPTIVLKEDSAETFSFSWLRGFVSDPNDPLESLTFQFDGAMHLSFEFDLLNEQVMVIPAPNFYGMDRVFFTVLDPYGMSDTDTLFVRVLPVEDPPSPFRLLSPANDTVLVSWDWPICFMWQRAVDPDSNDAVQYSLILSDNPELKGNGTSRTTFIKDTSIYVAPQKNGEYYWAVEAEDKKSNVRFCESIFHFRVQKSAVENSRLNIPEAFGLSQNYPNPFNSETQISFEVPNPSRVLIQILNIEGRTVRVLLDSRMEPGVHQIHWDGLDDQGGQVASGVYTVQMKADGFIEHRKVVVLR